VITSTCAPMSNADPGLAGRADPGATLPLTPDSHLCVVDGRSRTSIEEPRSRVLVVDDEPLIRWAIGEELAAAGCAVVQAADGRGAVSAVAESTPFDIIVLDLRLPDCDDLSLLARLRSLTPTTRIILMSAHGTPELAAHAFDLGAFNFLQKPFDLADIAALVAAAGAARPS